MTAVKLRILLVIVLFVVIVIGVVGFIFLRSKLVEKANDTIRVSDDAKGSTGRVKSLTDAQKILEENAMVEFKAQAMVAESKSYQYQDLIVRDIYAIATKAGVQVSLIDFGAGTTGTPTSNAAGVATPKTPALPGGVNQTKANITIKNPVSYDKLLAFISYLEHNTMRIQVSKVGITGTGKSADGHAEVNSEVFTIGVYIR